MFHSALIDQRTRSKRAIADLNLAEGSRLICGCVCVQSTGYAVLVPWRGMSWPPAWRVSYAESCQL